MLRIAIHGSSPVELPPQLAQLVISCGGWILEEELLPGAAYSLRFEVDLSNFSEIYGALLRTGMQFTPAAHRALTQVCFCQKHLLGDEETQIVSIDLHVGTREEEMTPVRSSPRQRSA